VYQGYVNTTLAAGFCLGPTLAATVVRWFGYLGTNMFFAVLILIFGLGGVSLLPERVNEKQVTTDDGEEDKQRDIPYSVFLKNRWSLMTVLAKGFAYLSF